tara:strand:- start:3514 stop:4041 length:528 start_codon:yes stop_codon:yes gene_type:complete
MPGDVRQLSVLLATSGGSADLTVDGSSSAVSFTLSAPADVTYSINRLVLAIHSTNMDLGTAADFQKFGAVGAALTNGIRIFESRGTPAVNVELFPAPVKRIADFYRYVKAHASAHIRGHTDGVSAGVDSLSVVLDLGPNPIVLRPNFPDVLTAYVQDDLTSLALFEVHAIGKQFR